MLDQSARVYRAQGTWVVRAGGAVLGETRAALELVEGDAAPVVFFPRADLAMAFFEVSDTPSHCPRKGPAQFYSIVTKSTRIKDAALSYPAPPEMLAALADHLCFAGDGVTVERV